MEGTEETPVEPTSPDISNTDENNVEIDTVNSNHEVHEEGDHRGDGIANGHIPHRQLDTTGADDKEGEGKSTKNHKRGRIFVNRGFMAVQSMVTAKLVDEYQLLQVLGQGFYGKVHLGASVNGSGETVAIKQLDERKFQREQFQSICEEFRALHKIIHPNIVAYKRILLDEPSIYVVTEFLENGSMYDAIQKTGPIPEVQVARYTKQLLNALNHLQELKIVHRNLKCSNVLLSKNGECKITDFALSHKHESNRYTIRGTPYWMAPEIIEMNGAAPTCAADIWGLGCIIVEMITGEPPYKKLGPMSALLSISRDERPPLPNNISDYLKHFLGHCFAKDPEQRHDAKMLRKHPWLTQGDETPATSNGTTAPSSRSTISQVPVQGLPPLPSENHVHPTPAPPTPQANPSPPNHAPVSSSPNSSPTSSPSMVSPISSTPHHNRPSSPSSPPPPTRAITPPPPISPNNNPFPTLVSQPTAPPPTLTHARSVEGANIVIDVYSETDKDDFELLEMVSMNESQDTPETIDEHFQFSQSSSYAATPGLSEVQALRREVEYLRELNNKNVESAQKLKEKFKNSVDIQKRLIDLSWRLRDRSDAAMDNIRQAAKATAHSNMLLKRTNQVATEALAHGTIVISNIRKLEEYILEQDTTGKKLMGIVFKRSITAESLVNPTIAGYLSYNTNTRQWKKDKEKRAWFVLKDNFLFAFKNEKGTTYYEAVYLGDGARLVPMSEDQSKKKFCFRLAEFFLLAADTAEQCSEWMLALSRPQKWYESSFEDPISPRISRIQEKDKENGKESSGFLPPTPDTPLPPIPNKSGKGRRGSNAGNHHGPVFGVPIEELFAREGGNIPYFFSRIIQFLEEKGLHEEGILRLSGSVAEINGLKESLQHGEDVDYSLHDPHAVAGLLKAFFRELPAPIIPEPYHSRILEVMFNQEVLDDQRVVEVKVILDQLPHQNRAILRSLMNFLVKVNCNADKNKMTIQNLITCMVPTLRCVPGVFMYVIPNYDFVFDIE